MLLSKPAVFLQRELDEIIFDFELQYIFVFYSVSVIFRKTSSVKSLIYYYTSSKKASKYAPSQIATYKAHSAPKSCRWQHFYKTLRVANRYI